MISFVAMVASSGVNDCGSWASFLRMGCIVDLMAGTFWMFSVEVIFVYWCVYVLIVWCKRGVTVGDITVSVCPKREGTWQG